MYVLWRGDIEMHIREPSGLIGFRGGEGREREERWREGEGREISHSDSVD